MDVVAYVRISSDRTGLEAGVGRQLADIRALAARQGDNIVTVADDNDESAYLRRKPRPGFTQVVNLIKAGEVGGIYAWHPDRLYRSLRDLEDLVDLVDAHGLIVRTVKAGDIDLGTATGRMTARVVGSMARYESEHKADRQARQHMQLAEAGRPSGGGRRPFGYLADKVTVEPIEAAALRAAAEHILAGGSTAEAARQLSATLGRTVRPNILRNLLTGPRVAGLRQHIPAADRRRGARVPALTEAVWPAIIDTATWNRLCVILLDPSRKNTRPPRTYLLSGIVSCTLCNTRMAGGNDSYKCSASNGGCGRIGVSMQAVDHYVTAWVKSEADRPAVAKRIARLADESAAAPTDSVDIEARQVELANLYADRVISADEWRIARDRLAVNSQAAKISDAQQARTTEAARRVADVIARWDSASVAEQRATVSAFVDRIDVEARGKRNGSKFDPARLHVVPRGTR